MRGEEKMMEMTLSVEVYDEARLQIGDIPDAYRVISSQGHEPSVGRKTTASEDLVCPVKSSRLHSRS